MPVWEKKIQQLKTRMTNFIQSNKNYKAQNIFSYVEKFQSNHLTDLLEDADEEDIFYANAKSF